MRNFFNRIFDVLCNRMSPVWLLEEFCIIIASFKAAWCIFLSYMDSHSSPWFIPFLSLAELFGFLGQSRLIDSGFFIKASSCRSNMFAILSLMQFLILLWLYSSMNPLITLSFCLFDSGLNHICGFQSCIREVNLW